MSIYINGRFLTQQLTGVQRFAYEITKSLVIIEPKCKIITPRGWLSDDYPGLKDNVVEVGAINGHLWEQVVLPFYLAKLGKPLLVNLGSTAPVVYGNSIYTLHDVAVKKFPKSFSWSFRMLYNFLIPICLKQSKIIITVSEFSRQEISNSYKVEAHKIHVIYNAVTSNLMDTVSAKFKGKPFLLAVSSLNPQKNFSRLIEAYQRLENPKFNLHIVGGWNKAFANNFVKGKNDNFDGIKFLGRISDEELVQQYKNADAFVFPSIYEGFGIPPIEAQRFGCPVISSDIQPLREVLGESALFFDPYSVNEMVQKISLLLEDETVRMKLRRLGKENVSRFKWSESAQKLHELIMINK